MVPSIVETNLTASNRAGTTVTGAGTAHTKGSWSELIASIGGDAVGLWVAVIDVGVANTDTSALLDIGVGAASSETVLIPDINVGGAGALERIGAVRFFPVSIASGTRISARLQGVVTSETAVVAVWLARSVQHLGGASAVEAVGENLAASRGTSVTPGNGAWGSWTSLGTISADRNVLMPGLDPLGDTAISGGTVHQLIQLGYGSSAPGSGGTEINAVWRVHQNSGEQVDGVFPHVPVYADLASGETIWARIASGAEVDARGVLVHAMECPAVGGGTAKIHDSLDRFAI